MVKAVRRYRTMKHILPVIVVLFFGVFVFLSLFHSKTSFAALANHVVISEVQIEGDAGADDEFIELYNPTSSPVDISNWSIQRETIGGAFAKRNFEALASIPAHGYYLIAPAIYNGTPTADLTQGSFTLSSTGTTVFLVNDQTLLTTGDEVTIVDKVAIGTNALDAEGSVFATIPVDDASIERKPGENSPTGGNGEDTDNNSADFMLRTVSQPQNSASPTENPDTTLSPTEEPSPTDVTPTEEPTETPTLTPTGEPSPTEEPSPSPTEEPSPSPTEEPTPSEEPSPSPTEEPSPTETPTPTLEPSPTTTVTPTPTPTVEPTPQTIRILAGIFPFSRKVCYLEYKPFVMVGFRFFGWPRLVCEVV